MRRFLLTLAVCLACLAAIPLVGCRTSPINGAALLPASQADLDALKADTDADRDTVVKGLDAVRADLTQAGIAVTQTEAAAAEAKRKADEVASRPESGGIGGALISAIAGSGIVPPWLDWILTLLLGGVTTAGEVNRRRNKTRAAALAKVAAPKTGTPPPAA